MQAGILNQEKHKKDRKIILREEKVKKEKKNKDGICKKDKGRITKKNTGKNWFGKDRHAGRNYSGRIVG